VEWSDACLRPGSPIAAIILELARVVARIHRG
jgi:hypothetical protein